MANTYTLIASSTVGAGGASSIDFTSIPATYTDLKLVVSARINEASTYGVTVLVKPNGATTNLSQRRLYGLGSGAPGSDTTTEWRMIAASTSQTASTFGNSELYIPNYAGSNNKSASGDNVSENNATDDFALLSAYLWSNTAAITSLTLTPNATHSFQQYTTAYLYGIKNS